MLIKIANSIAATRIIGNETDLNTQKIIMKIATIDTALTVLKSLSVMVIKSFVHGASPITMEFWSYFFAIASIVEI